MMIKTHLWFFAYTVFVFWYYYAILCYIMLHYSIIALIVYMHIVCIYIYVTWCLCRAGFASVPCYLLNLAQVGRDSMGYIARLTVNGITVSSRLCRIRACHHVPSRAITCHDVPWRAMTCHDVPWSHDVMKSADCQVLTARCTKSFQDADYLRCTPCKREMDGKRWNTLQHLRICWKVIHPFWRNLFKQDKYGANSESMLALSVHPEAIASGFASSVGGPEMAVERDFTGFPVAKVAFLLDLVALVSK